MSHTRSRWARSHVCCERRINQSTVPPTRGSLFPVLAPKASENSFCWPWIVLFSAEMPVLNSQMCLCVGEGGFVAEVEPGGTSLSLMLPAQVYRGNWTLSLAHPLGDASHMASKITAGNTQPRRVNRGHWICCNSEMLLEDNEILRYSFRSWIYCLKLEQQKKTP